MDYKVIQNNCVSEYKTRTFDTRNIYLLWENLSSAMHVSFVCSSTSCFPNGYIYVYNTTHNIYKTYNYTYTHTYIHMGEIALVWVHIHTIETPNARVVVTFLNPKANHHYHYHHHHYRGWRQISLMFRLLIDSLDLIRRIERLYDSDKRIASQNSDNLSDINA